MSAVSGDAAEQVVRMSLEGTEMAVKLAGSGAKQLAILLYAVLKDQKKTSGKVRLANMLRSGRELKVFAIHDHDLPKFCEEAKKYGVLFTVLKDRDANDGLTDIMVRAEDASKINRIFERFKLSTVDMGSVKAQIEQEKARSEKDVQTKDEEIVPPERVMTQQEKVDAFIEEATKGNPTKEEQQTSNPTEGRTARSRQSEPFSEKRSPIARDASNDPERRPSVRKQLAEIRKQQKETAEAGKKKSTRQTQEHKQPKKKRKKKEERA